MKRLFSKDGHQDGQKKINKKGIKKRLMTVLACFVVFTTTYALILPAITADQSAASKEAGFFLGNENASDDAAAAEANVLDDTSGNEASGTASDTQNVTEALPVSTSTGAAAVSAMPGTSTAEESAQSIPAAQIPQTTEGVIAMPAQELFAELKDYTVKVYAPEGSLPEGTTIALEAIAEEPEEDLAIIDAFSDRIDEQILAVRKEARLAEAKIDAAAELEDGRTADEAISDAVDEMIDERASSYKEGTVLRNIDGALSTIQAFTIKYMDAEGNEIYPIGKVNVTVTTGSVTKEQTLITSESKPEDYTASAEDIMVVRLTDKVTKDDVAFAKAVGIDTDKNEVIFDTDTFDGAVPAQGVCPSYALITTAEPDISAIAEELSEAVEGEDGAGDADNGDVSFSDDNNAANDVAAGADGENDAAVAAADTENVSDEDAAEDPSDVVANVAGTITAEGKDYQVSLSYDAAAGIPDGATLSVKEFRKGFPKYRKYLSQAEDSVHEADQNTSEIQFARFYDITILDEEGNEIEPATPVRVEITYDEAIEAAKGAAFKAVHFGDEETEVIAAKADGDADTVSAVSFAAESFSVYGIVYTVDFSYGEYAFSIPGEGSIKLSEVLEKLGIAVDVKDVENVTFSDDTLVTVRKRLIGNDWVLKSLQPFETEETLCITLKDGTEIIITVTDASEGTSELRALLTSATININNQNVTGTSWEVKKGQNYEVSLTFSEEADTIRQIDVDADPLYYTLPTEFKASSLNKAMVVTSDGIEYSGNSFEVDPATNRVILHLTEETKTLIRTSGTTKMRIDLFGHFDSDASNVKFSDTITKDVVVDGEHNVTIEKTGRTELSNNKIVYTVKVKSTGHNTNIRVSDQLTGEALSLQGTVGFSSTRNGAPTPAVEYDNGGFNLTIDEMNDGEEITLTYEAAVDRDKITGNGTVQQTENTVTMHADDVKEKSDSTNFENKISYPNLSKNKKGDTLKNDTRTVNWEIVANEKREENMGGKTLTDKITSNNMKYSGEGIQVVRFAENGQKYDEYDVKWGSNGLSNSKGSTEWTYTIPTDDHKYKYVITYTTDVDVTGQISNTDISNEVSYPGVTPAKGEGSVGPGSSDTHLTKTVAAGSPTEEYIDWTVSFVVPEAGLSTAYLHDNLPSYGECVDTFDGIIGDVTGLLPGESYTTSVEGNGYHLYIRFKQANGEDGLGARYGKSEAERTITLTYRTRYDQEWLKLFENSNTNATRYNKIHLNDIVTAEANTKPPIEKKLTKTATSAGTITVDGKEVPIYRYTVKFYGVDDGGITFEDQYSKGLKFYPIKENCDNSTNPATHNYISGLNVNSDPFKNAYFEQGLLNETWGFNSMRYPTITEDTSHTNYNRLTWELKGNEIAKNLNTNEYFDEYTFTYYLIVDPDQMENLYNQSADANGKIQLSNHAKWKEASSEQQVDVDFEYPAVDKSMTGLGPADGTIVSENTAINASQANGYFKIVLNPAKKNLVADSETLTMTDEFTNLSVDYSTIQVTVEPAEKQNMVKWNYSGNVGTFTIPDEAKVTITYKARVVGEGKVTFSNTASMLGFSDTVTEKATVGGSGAIDIEVNKIRIFKYEGYEMNKGVAGAVYVLADASGNPVVYPSTAKTGNYITIDGVAQTNVERAGKPITIITGNDGYATLLLDQNQDGRALQKGVKYYLKEVHAPDGYQVNPTLYNFTISEQPNYDNKESYEYYSNDILKMWDDLQKGVLEIDKKVTINNQNDKGTTLTETQKKNITFKLTGVDANGKTIQFNVKDAEGNTVKASQLNFTYADFTNGKYRLEDLDPGTYTVQETNNNIDGFSNPHTDVANGNDAVAGTVDNNALTFTFNISEDEAANVKHVVNYTNSYTSQDYTFTVVKVDNTGTVKLGGAEFRLYKKDASSGEYIYFANGSLDSEGKFTIPYDSRENGVTIRGLKAGEYQLTETKAPEGFRELDDPILFTINDSGNVVYSENANKDSQNNVMVTQSNNTFTVKNGVEHGYTISKVEKGQVSKKLTGAEFTVHKTDANGHDLGEVKTYTTDTDGQFEILKGDIDGGYQDGQLYYIVESKAPAGYKINTQKYYFYFSDSSVATPDDNHTKKLGNSQQYELVEDETTTKDLEVVKNWRLLGDNGADVSATVEYSTITYKLMQIPVIDGVEGEAVQYPDDLTFYTLTRDQYGAWNTKHSGLPVGTSNGGHTTVYKYKAIEVDTPSGWIATATVAGEGEGRTTITNRPESTELEVYKNWTNVPSGQQNEVTVNLYRDPEAGETADYTEDGHNWIWVARTQLNSGKNWHDTFIGLGKNYTYHVIESGLQNGITPIYSNNNTYHDGDAINISNVKQDDTELGVLKVWNDDGTNRPRAVSVKLKKNVGISSGHTVVAKVVSKDAHSSVLGSSQPVLVKDGTSVTVQFGMAYGVVDGVDQNYEYSVTGEGDSRVGTFTVNNVTEDQEILILSGWGGGSSPISIINYTAADVSYTGEPVDVTEEEVKNADNRNSAVVVLSEDNGWYASWKNLPSSGSDGLYAYYVEEIVPSDYTVSYDKNNGNTTGLVTITNTKTESEDTSVTVEKKWNNASKVTAEQNAWPEGVEIVATLKDSSGKAVTKPESAPATWTNPVTLRKTEQETYTWTDLDKSKTYVVEETSLALTGTEDAEQLALLKAKYGFTTAKQVSVGNDGKAVLTNTEKTTEVNLQKIWPNSDGGNTEISYDLYQTTEQPEYVTVTLNYEKYDTTGDIPKQVDASKEIKVLKGSTVTLYTTHGWWDPYNTSEAASDWSHYRVKNGSSIVPTTGVEDVTINWNTYKQRKFSLGKVNADTTVTIDTKNMSDISGFLDPVLDAEAPANSDDILYTSGKLTSAKNWQDTVSDLPVYKIVNGEVKKVYYYIVETELNYDKNSKVKRFETTYSGAVDATDSNKVLTITNRKRDDYTWLEVNKSWINETGSHPRISVVLYRKLKTASADTVPEWYNSISIEAGDTKAYVWDNGVKTEQEMFPGKDDYTFGWYALDPNYNYYIREYINHGDYPESANFPYVSTIKQGAANITGVTFGSSTDVYYPVTIGSTSTSNNVTIQNKSTKVVFTKVWAENSEPDNDKNADDKDVYVRIKLHRYFADGVTEDTSFKDMNTDVVWTFYNYVTGNKDATLDATDGSRILRGGKQADDGQVTTETDPWVFTWRGLPLDYVDQNDGVTKDYVYKVEEIGLVYRNTIRASATDKREADTEKLNAAYYHLTTNNGLTITNYPNVTPITVQKTWAVGSAPESGTNWSAKFQIQRSLRKIANEHVKLGTSQINAQNWSEWENVTTDYKSDALTSTNVMGGVVTIDQSTKESQVTVKDLPKYWTATQDGALGEGTNAITYKKGDVFEIKYQAVETGLIIDGKNEIANYVGTVTAVGTNDNEYAVGINNAEATTEVTVNKTWSAELPEKYTWSAEFALEYALRPYTHDGVEASAAEKSAQLTFQNWNNNLGKDLEIDVPNVTITNETATQNVTYDTTSGKATSNAYFTKFAEKLPKYHTVTRTEEVINDGVKTEVSHTDVYEIVYSVTEPAVKVYDNTSGTPVEVTDHSYICEILDDAENSNDYNVIAVNQEEQRINDTFIDIDIEKKWNKISNPDDSYSSKLVLKRYMHREYIERRDVDASKKDVKVTLMLGSNKASEITVKEGSTVSISATMAARKSGTATFNRNDGGTDITMPVDWNVDKINQLQSFVVGSKDVAISISDTSWFADGENGAHLTEAYQVTQATEDTQTSQYNNVEFTLSNSAGWTKEFKDLPLTETVMTDNTIITTVYGYYFEEKSNTPENYAPIFTMKNSTVSLGDENNRIYRDASVVATNVEKKIRVEKIWYHLIAERMPPVLFKVYQMDDQNGTNAKEITNWRAFTDAGEEVPYSTNVSGSGYSGYILEDGAWALNFDMNDLDMANKYYYVEEVGFVLSSTEFVPLSSLQNWTNKHYKAVANSYTLPYASDTTGKLDNKSDIENNANKAYLHGNDVTYGTFGIYNAPSTGYQIAFEKKWYPWENGGTATDLEYKNAKATIVITQQAYELNEETPVGQPFDFGLPIDIIYNKDATDAAGTYKDPNSYIISQGSQWKYNFTEENFPTVGYVKNDDGTYKAVAYGYSVRETEVVDTLGRKWVMAHLEESKDSKQRTMYNFEAGELDLFKVWDVADDADKKTVYLTVECSSDTNYELKKTVAGNTTYTVNKDVMRYIIENGYERDFGLNDTNFRAVKVEIDEKTYYCLALSGDITSDVWSYRLQNLDMYVMTNHRTTGSGEVTYTIQEVGVGTDDDHVVALGDSGYRTTYDRKNRDQEWNLNNDGAGIQLNSNQYVENANNNGEYRSKFRINNTNKPTTSITLHKKWASGAPTDGSTKITFEVQQRYRQMADGDTPLTHTTGEYTGWQANETGAATITLPLDKPTTQPKDMNNERWTEVQAMTDAQWYATDEAWTYTWDGLNIYKRVSATSGDAEINAIVEYRVVETSFPGWFDPIVDEKFAIEGGAANATAVAGTGEKPATFEEEITNTENKRDVTIDKNWTRNGSALESWPEGYTVKFKLVRHVYLVDTTVNNGKTSYTKGVELYTEDVDISGKDTLSAEKQSQTITGLFGGTVWTCDLSKLSDATKSELETANVSLVDGMKYVVFYEYEAVELTTGDKPATYVFKENSDVADENMTARPDKNAETLEKKELSATLKNEITDLVVEKKWTKDGTQAAWPEGAVILYRVDRIATYNGKTVDTTEGIFTASAEKGALTSTNASYTVKDLATSGTWTAPETDNEKGVTKDQSYVVDYTYKVVELSTSTSPAEGSYQYSEISANAAKITSGDNTGKLGATLTNDYTTIKVAKQWTKNGDTEHPIDFPANYKVAWKVIRTGDGKETEVANSGKFNKTTEEGVTTISLDNTVDGNADRRLTSSMTSVDVSYLPTKGIKDDGTVVTYTYKVVEDPTYSEKPSTSGYEFSEQTVLASQATNGTGDDAGKKVYTLTNDLTEVDVTKTWEGDAYADSVTVKLYRTTEEVTPSTSATVNITVNLTDADSKATEVVAHVDGKDITLTKDGNTYTGTATLTKGETYPITFTGSASDGYTVSITGGDIVVHSADTQDATAFNGTVTAPVSTDATVSIKVTLTDTDSKATSVTANVNGQTVILHKNGNVYSGDVTLTKGQSYDVSFSGTASDSYSVSIGNGTIQVGNDDIQVWSTTGTVTTPNSDTFKLTIQSKWIDSNYQTTTPPTDNSVITCTVISYDNSNVKKSFHFAANGAWPQVVELDKDSYKNAYVTFKAKGIQVTEIGINYDNGMTQNVGGEDVTVGFTAKVDLNAVAPENGTITINHNGEKTSGVYPGMTVTISFDINNSGAPVTFLVDENVIWRLSEHNNDETYSFDYVVPNDSYVSIDVNDSWHVCSKIKIVPLSAGARQKRILEKAPLKASASPSSTTVELGHEGTSTSVTTTGDTLFPDFTDTDKVTLVDTKTITADSKNSDNTVSWYYKWNDLPTKDPETGAAYHYYVVEDVPTNTKQVDYSRSENGDTTVSIKNTPIDNPEYASIKVTKKVEGADTDRLFTIRLKCDDKFLKWNSKAVDGHTWVNNEAQATTWTFNDGGSVTFTGLQQGYTYTVIEDTGDVAIDGYTFNNSSTTSATVEISGDDTTEHSVTITNKYDEATKDFFFNKEWYGVDSTNTIEWPTDDKDNQIPIKVTLTRKLKVEDGDTLVEETGKKFSKTYELTPSSHGDWSVESSVNTYTFTIKGLEKSGMIGESKGEWMYFIAENSDELDGYHTEYILSTGPSEHGGVDQVDNGGKIKNILTTYELPSTGGFGTLSLKKLGMLCMILAAAICVFIAYKKNRQINEILASRRGGDSRK